MSRKEFFRRSLLCVGESLLRAGAAVREARGSLALAPPLSEPPESTDLHERDSVLHQRDRAPEGPYASRHLLHPGPSSSGGMEVVEPAEAESHRPPVCGPQLVAHVDNRHCLARSCGCFSCLDCCEAGAISLVLGTGIAIDPALCHGCGACHAICPLAPVAIKMGPRSHEAPLPLISRAPDSGGGFAPTI